MAIMGSVRKLWILLLAVSVLILWNEFVVYYFVMLQCSWPLLEGTNSDFKEYFKIPLEKEPLRAMFLADTHLLGKRAHWFDKLRREWQMYRSFQSAMFLFNPEAVFILGDIMDEGQWSSDAEFRETVERFQRMFKVSGKTDLEIAMGNHDIGFHYMVTDHKRERFNQAFNAPSVKMVHLKENTFILLNSMAFEGDQCSMCKETELQLQKIAHTLSCARGEPEPSACIGEESFKYSRPIVLQHFPMYRVNDAECTGPDSAGPEEKYVKMKQKMDCLSKKASDTILNLIKPRLVISGHTHNYCYRMLADDIPEYSVPSFNWRNRVNPSFLLVKIDKESYSVNKCFLPNEDTVIQTYTIGVVIILLWFIIPSRYYGFRTARTSNAALKKQ